MSGGLVGFPKTIQITVAMDAETLETRDTVTHREAMCIIKEWPSDSLCGSHRATQSVITLRLTANEVQPWKLGSLDPCHFLYTVHDT